MDSDNRHSEKLARRFEENFNEATRAMATLQVIGIALLAAHGVADDRFKQSFRAFVRSWLEDRGVDEDEFHGAVTALEELLDHSDIPSILRH